VQQNPILNSTCCAFIGVCIMGISSRHNVNGFVAGKSEPLTGQRLAKIGYKKTKDNPNPPASVCASVPMIAEESILGNITALVPHIRTMLEGVQDSVIRSLYESSDHTLTSVSDDDISVSACIAFMLAESQGSRLSADSIGIWFDSAVRDNLTVVVADKLKFDLSTPEQEQTVARHVNGSRALMQSIAGKNVTLQPKQLQGIENALALASTDDAMSAKIRAKVDSLKNVKSVEELLEL
jgi:hypothetical protein